MKEIYKVDNPKKKEAQSHITKEAWLQSSQEYLHRQHNLFIDCVEIDVIKVSMQQTYASRNVYF